MKKEDLFESIGEIKDEYVEEAHKECIVKKKRNNAWMKYISTVAGIAALFAVIVIFGKYVKYMPETRKDEIAIPESEMADTDVMTEADDMSPEYDGDSADESGELYDKEEFSFSLTWGCYGVSSYDSKTGKLIKTTDATNPEDYVTDYQLTDEDKEYFYDLISLLDINSYPDEYDPDNGESTPSMTLILSVNIDGMQKTIKAEDIALSYDSRNKKGQRFLAVCEIICDRLMATKEWKSLPEYEKLYD